MNSVDSPFCNPYFNIKDRPASPAGQGVISHEYQCTAAGVPAPAALGDKSRLTVKEYNGR